MRLPRPARRIAPALAVAAACALPLLSACGNSSSAGGSTEGRLDLSHAASASFEAHGSVEQVWVIDAQPGDTLDLAKANGTVVQSAATDANGSLIFKEVDAGSYRVASKAGGTLSASPSIEVTIPENPPDESFYESQHIEGGYGYLQTRDGTLLSIMVYLPGPPENGPYPTVVEYSGYAASDPNSPQPSTQFATLLGYAAVAVNIRGTGCSGGAFNFFETLQSTDGYDVVETVAHQSWVKGNKVGMVGISYPGISQLFTAQFQPPHLAAIAPLSVIADTGRGTLYPGGLLNNGFAVDWSNDRQHDAMPGGQAWSQKRLDEGDQTCIANMKLRDQTPNLLDMIHENNFYDPKIADPLSPTTFVQKIDVPVFLAGAWQDEQTGPYFATMLDHFTGTDNAHFTMVNGGHADSLDPLIFSRWDEFLSLYVKDEVPHVADELKVFIPTLSNIIFGTSNVPTPTDRFADVQSLDEARARFAADPKVRLLLESGAGGEPGAPVPSFEVGFDAWPIPSVQPTAWFLGEGGALTPAAPSGDGADSYLYDPSRSQVSTCPGCGDGVWLELPPFVWTPPAQGTSLTYQTEPLTESTVMAGSGSVDLYVESTARDTDLQVVLSEVHPDGTEFYVQAGWLRASHRKLDDQRSTELRPVQTHLRADAADLPAGKFSLTRVELFPFAHVFHAGSRVRLSIEGPGAIRPQWKFDALPAEANQVNTIGRSAGQPSRIVLPVIPNVSGIPATLPVCPSLRGQPCRSAPEIHNTPA